MTSLVVFDGGNCKKQLYFTEMNTRQQVKPISWKLT